MSKPDLSRWPNLQLATHPVLDWVETTYEPATLLLMAEAISKNPHPIQTRAAAGQPGAWDSAIEQLISTLADSPAALKALNQRRPLPPRKVVGLNRAVHFLVRLEMRGSGETKRALSDVAKVWDSTEATIKEDRTTFSVKTPTEYRHDDAKRIAAQIINDTSVTRGMTRTEVLEAFDADMKRRAKQWLDAKRIGKNRRKFPDL